MLAEFATRRQGQLNFRRIVFGCRYAQDQPKLREIMKVPQIAARYVLLNVEMPENPAEETAELCRPSSNGKMVLMRRCNLPDCSTLLPARILTRNELFLLEIWLLIAVSVHDPCPHLHTVNRKLGPYHDK